MIDKANEYRQALIELDMNIKNYIPNDIYATMFESQLEKIKELLDELDNLPEEINRYKSVNDNHHLRAFISEELRRNKLLELMIKKSISCLRMEFKCPEITAINCKQISADICDDKYCTDCWLKSLQIEAEKEIK